MPRQHKRHVPIVAASPAYVAAMLMIQPDDMSAAIRAGEIKFYQIGTRRRVVLDDAIQWLRTNKPRSRKPKAIGVSKDV